LKKESTRVLLKVDLLSYLGRHIEEINARYISNTFRKKFEGVLICQVQSSESEFPDDTFIMVGWEVSLFRSARFYTVLVETGHDEVVWDLESMRDQHRSFHNRLGEHPESIVESWTLGINTKIRLIADLAGNKDYNLKIAIREDEPEDEDADYPIRVALKR
jgi:hypothetical protein